jgi:hypothetical protein
MSNDTPAFHLSVSQQTLRRFYQLVILVDCLLIFMTLASDLGLAFTQHRIASKFDLDNEATVAVWYSSSLLLLTGLAALAISSRVPPQITKSGQYRFVWLLAALFFFGLSTDETAQLHEWAGGVFTHNFGETLGINPGPRLDFDWLPALLPLIICFLVVMRVAVQWLRVHQRSRTFALAGVVCWIGVLIAEFIQAQLRRLSMDRSVEATIEEGLEIIGTTFFLASFLEFLRYSRSESSLAVPLRQTERGSTLSGWISM